MREGGARCLDEVGYVIICSVVRALTDNSRLQFVLCPQSSCTILSPGQHSVRLSYRLLTL